MNEVTRVPILSAIGKLLISMQFLLKIHSQSSLQDFSIPNPEFSFFPFKWAIYQWHTPFSGKLITILFLNGVFFCQTTG